MPSQEISPPARPPWGFWATMGFSLLAVVILLAVQVIVVVAFFAVAMAGHPGMNVRSLENNGLMLALATCFSTPFAVAAAVLFAWTGRGPSIRDYFGLHSPTRGQYVKWTLAVVALISCSEVLSFLLGRPATRFMVDAYRSAGFMPLLWLAIIVAAPLGEEVLFRGFLFKGLRDSRVGPIGAILISSLAWSALHANYPLFDVTVIFLGGLLLGAARLKSDSLYVPLAMHVVWNVIAMSEVAIYVGAGAK